jgi:hypothetical protein
VTYRVIQWATGGVGRAAIEGVLDHPDLELAGCFVYGAEKDGRDVGEILGRGKLGVRATRDAAQLLAVPADCVVYSPLVGNAAEVTRILAAGRNVVTPLGWFHPFGNRGVAEIEAACRAGNATLHGTGIHPGGISDRFPLVISALSRAITHVRAEEWSDIRTYGAPAVISGVMGFGKTPDEASRGPMLALLGAGFLQSVQMLAAALGFALDPEPRTRHELAVATQPIDSPIGAIAPGRVAAQRFSWQGTVRGEAVITVRVNWLMGEAHLDPPFCFGPEGERFEIEIQGDPSVKTVFHGLHPESIAAGLARNPGIVATAQHCVNAIPSVCEAPPGIRTYLDLPAYHGRAARRLRRGAA